jgi:hypothetical protein
MRRGESSSVDPSAGVISGLLFFLRGAWVVAWFLKAAGDLLPPALKQKYGGRRIGNYAPMVDTGLH